MATGWLVPFLAGVVAGIFAAKVWGQWSVRRRPHQLAWASGLTLYSLATFVEAYTSSQGWSEISYRVFFLAAAANVGLLGLGTVLLSRVGWWGRAFALLIIAGIAVAGLAQLTVPLDGATLDGTAEAIPFPHPARIAFLLLNVVGGLALIGGAILSYAQTRAFGVLLIGVGALLPFLGGTLSTFTALDLRVPLQLLGIVVMFIGYLRGRETE